MPSKKSDQQDKQRTELKSLVAGLLAKTGNSRSLAKLLTLLERVGPEALAIAPELLEPSASAFRVGITGPPGAGKSTLISQLIGHWRGQNLKVGVVAVDPSSPFSEGAILGDRIRYQDHVLDDRVFIRSLGSRGSLGGLSSSAWLMVRAFDLAGFDLVLLETVGVGQTELEIMNVADHVCVVLTPESGDGIQGMKAGLMEIADTFVVNKSDRPGADVFAREIEASLELNSNSLWSKSHGAPPQVFKVSALSGAGLSEFAQAVEAVRTKPEKWRPMRSDSRRLQAEARAMLMDIESRAIGSRVSQIQTPGDLGNLFRQIKK